jgi:hypothetical protein
MGGLAEATTAPYLLPELQKCNDQGADACARRYSVCHLRLRGPSINGSSVFADNFTAVPGPIAGAGLRGLILAGGGPGVLAAPRHRSGMDARSLRADRPKKVQVTKILREMLEFGQSL